MKTISILFIVFLTITNLLSAQATSPTPELPVGPLLQSAGPYSQWQIAYSYPEDRLKSSGAKSPFAPTDSRPRAVLVTKTESTIREATTDVLDRIIERWFVKGVQYTKKDRDPIWYQADASPGSFSYDPLPPSGFRQLDWVTPENYAGTLLYGGTRQCLIFTPGGIHKIDLKGPQRDQKIAALDMVAYIDAETRLPIAVRLRGELRSYRFDSPPTEMQALPADLSVQIKRGQEARAALYSRPPTP